MKFYDVARRRPTIVPDRDVSYAKKHTSKGTITMATAIGPAGNKLYKIVKREV
jgi:hypothetical protein